jgi:Acetyltransferase (GNAT) family
VSVPALPDSGIRVSRARLDDPRLDDFSCGDEPWAQEGNDEIRSRDWAEDDDLTVFTIDDEIVACARMAFARYPHPEHASKKKAKYLALLALGVAAGHRGGRDPGNEARSIVSTVLAHIEQMARAEAGCVGVSLHVREPNMHARGVYAHAGFSDDPGGAFSEGGLVTIEMRLLF